MPQLAGKATINFDGTQLATENGAKLNPGGANRKAERHGGRSYYQEEEVAGDLECQVLLTKDADVVALSNAVGITVQFTADTGQKFVCRGGVTTEPVVFDTGAGKAPLKMTFDSVDPM
jgi:type 1 fimbria pilin